ncbi:hypothetical protein AWB91_06700 [Mycobacterium paraense]|uniref:Uncharacterized protein n=1 Tax=Mycobacterium paraense TaxID=767916 RepID=A0A1X2ALQ7_9MYCO|nr:hypothetical protein [Mycobacterium paraense]ORW33840.1 hypothetical protein AWB91_06700 [Mycobacterium paraense]ORW42069.1 hypothetical protein AWB88_11670 [Mycobacterium paraense]ORW52196.1 hypothetical protein AWB90_03005 [Mycobacterium paraense]
MSPAPGELRAGPVCERVVVVPEPQLAEALRQASSYLWIADVAGKRNLPMIQSLYSFAARQMVAYTEDGDEWHLRAAVAAARDATKMHHLLTERGAGAPGTLTNPTNL